MDIRSAIDRSKMSPYQWVIVAVAVFLNALDGYDVLAMAFTATAVTKEFDLSGSQLGWLLSTGLIGMAIGALVLGPFADRYGRRKILILSLSLNTLGLLLSATAGSAVQLGLWRVVTGLGIGGILASITVIVSEYSNNRYRGMAISIYTAGYALGATLGGMGATQLIPAFGWRSVFLVGGLLTLAAIALTAALLPESVDWLRAHRPADAQARVERIARRIGVHNNVQLGPAPVTAATTGRQGSLATLLSRRYRIPSVLLWISFFLIMFGLYFANTWTPRLLVESGMSEQQGLIGGIMLSAGGTVGSVLYGVLTTKWEARPTLTVFTLLSALTFVAFITTTSVPFLAFSSGVLVGVLINGCIAGMYTIAPQTYEPGIRTTGVGWGIGIGRIGAILAPISVGTLLDAGWTPVQLYIGVAAVVGLAALAIWRLRPYEETTSLETTERSPEAPATTG